MSNNRLYRAHLATQLREFVLPLLEDDAEIMEFASKREEVSSLLNNIALLLEEDANPEGGE